MCVMIFFFFLLVSLFCLFLVGICDDCICCILFFFLEWVLFFFFWFPFPVFLVWNSGEQKKWHVDFVVGMVPSLFFVLAPFSSVFRLKFGRTEELARRCFCWNGSSPFFCVSLFLGFVFQFCIHGRIVACFVFSYVCLLFLFL